MDHPHALAVVVIATPIVSIPVSLISSVLISLDIFPFRWIVDVVVVVVVRVVHDFLPI